ncbi:MAG: enoyl-CoA hydratase/isomerase family protein [bacterium]
MLVQQKKFLELTVKDRILTVTIDNPPENKLNHEMFLELDTCRDILSSPDIDLVIFTGQGNIFSKGFDMDLIRACPDSGTMKEHLTFIHGIYALIGSLPKPVIAAINGHCFGGGLELALVCHLRLCSEKARLGLPELSNGIIPGLGGIHRLAHVVGQAKAFEMIGLGDVISASEGLRIGLVNRVLPKGGFMPAALAIAKTLLMVDQYRMREVMQLLRDARVNNEQENIQAIIDSFVNVCFGRKERSGLENITRQSAE